MFKFPLSKTAAGIRIMVFAIFAAMTATSGTGFALTINAVEPDGTPVSGFRWLIEEDNTLQTPPGIPTNLSITTSINKSHAPVVAAGETNNASANVAIPAAFSGKPLMVSVLPFAGHTQGGANSPAGSTSVDVIVNSYPLETAQISILVFNDNRPINNAPDAGEPGLQGFKVLLDDTAGHQTLDAFGNLLGTTYATDGFGEFILVDGQPQVLVQGPGYVLTNADGEAFIKYLPPGKYGVNVAVPEGENWIQTATIEGTPTIDAWVKANEPEVFLEGFGTGFYHVFFGFINPAQMPWHSALPQSPYPADPNSANLSGTVRYNHFSAPPNLQGNFPGTSVPECYLGINDALTKEALYVTGPLPEDVNGYSSFDIQGLPPGQYELVTWDGPLDALFNIATLIVHPGQNVVGPLDTAGNPPPSLPSLDILSFRWFGTFKGKVFYDQNENGFPDPGEDFNGLNLNEVGINLRYRDGAIYQSQPTDNEGGYELSEVFPFFKWLVAEVDFVRHKATGMTAVVDAGGEIPVSSPDWLAEGERNPKQQPATGETPASTTGETLTGPLYRTEQGPVLTQAIHLFHSQNNRIDWGKAPYATGENGGISGAAVYATTRAVDDPSFEAQELHEPLIPRVQVALYTDFDFDQAIDDINPNDPPATLADVDNYPLGWIDGDPKGPEDIDRNGNNVFDAGDAVQITHTDSFDDLRPSDCVWGDRPVPMVAGSMIDPCSDSFATWNQIRPGVFDGGYAFSEYYPDGFGNGTPSRLPSSRYYIVEASPPPGYILQKEEDKNVDFGDSFVPSPLALPPTCVGNEHTVPPYLSLYTVGGLGQTPLPGLTAGDMVDTATPGAIVQLCDRKWVELRDKQNSPCDFHFFTMAPKAARAVGFANNDLGAEFDQTSPIYGEKPAPTWVPISFQDWAGNEVSRVYTDEYGHYNALLPSNYTNNLPTPLGYGPQMLTVYLNHPWLTNAGGSKTIDPNYDPNYSQMAWTFMYYPGRTSYLDTPLVPLGGFVGYPDFGLDVEPASGSPVIAQVTGPGDTGPILVDGADTLSITAIGQTSVPNPAFSSLPGNVEPEFILRDFGFGNVEGTVTLGGVPLDITQWTSSFVTVAVPGGNIGALDSGQLVVTRGDNGIASEIGVTVHVAPTGAVHYVNPGESIQAVIDDPGVLDGDLVFVRPGNYNEAVIVYKNLRMQGFGGYSTQIYSYPEPLSEIQEWHEAVQGYITAGQMKNAGDMVTFRPIERPGFLVLVNDARVDNNPAGETSGTRMIDGFAITGSVAGGGIQVPDLGNDVVLSNNIIYGNLGTRGGGVTIGMKEDETRLNPDVSVRWNRIVKNSGKDGGAGGISVYYGSSGYTIANNRIMGNFSTLNGGGIYHYGLSDNGLIQDNIISFNEIFYGLGIGGEGGGIWLGGHIVAGGLAEGAGNVSIIGNLIQGNLAGSASGGGIRALSFSGADIDGTGGYDGYELEILNNVIVNNVSAYSGGAISLQDVENAVITHNTIAKNVSSASALAAFLPNAGASTPQVAGVSTEPHSDALALATGSTYSNPIIEYNIIYQNLSYVFDRTIGQAGDLTFDSYRDLGVLGGTVAQTLDPRYCILTSEAGYDASNDTTPPSFIQAYENDLYFSVVIDEGGNNISARMSPLTLSAGDYHLNSNLHIAGATTDDTTYPVLALDFDNEVRNVANPDIGADEYYAAAAQPNLCAGDLDGDNDVDLQDLRAFRICSNTIGCLTADIDGDNDVDADDYLILNNTLGNVCTN